MQSPILPALSAGEGLDAARYGPAFRQDGRVRLPAALPALWAQSLHDALARQTPWQRALWVNGRGVAATGPMLSAIPEADRRKMSADIMREARDGFQYTYDTWPVSDEVEAGRRTGHPAEAFYDFINSEPFLRFIRKLGGDDRAVYCDAQCSRYGPGDFLNVHNDHVQGKDRLYAYVMNLTPQWRTDWGGLLLFPDDVGHVSQGFTPAFNALNLFRVPQPHFVSLVAPFAGGPRLSITGWVRARKP